MDREPETPGSESPLELKEVSSLKHLKMWIKGDRVRDGIINGPRTDPCGTPFFSS